MRWDDFRRSDNVEDRRGDDSSSSGGFGGGAGGLGIGAVIVLGLIGWALGIDPRVLINGAEILTGGGQTQQAPSPGAANPTRTAQPTDQMGQFVAAVLGNTEDRWTEIFQAAGKTYQPPKLVMFSGATRSGCGTAQSAMGPFYCPNDQHVYLDTAFFRQIETRFHGCDAGSKACQFSQAYVIAHEVGHHVQNLLGILPKAEQAQRSEGKSAANQVQVRIELQADCLAGVWANRSQQKLKFIEPGDVDAALQTASAIGDDTLQKQTQGYVVPDAFTHGTAEQRKRWFTNGFKAGTIESCNTFGAAQL
jgi:predicted metalloprotease